MKCTQEKTLDQHHRVCVQNLNHHYQHHGSPVVSLKAKENVQEIDQRKLVVRRKRLPANVSKARSMADLCQIIQQNRNLS